MANHAPHTIKSIPAVARLTRPLPTVMPRDSATIMRPSRTPTTPGTKARKACGRLQCQASDPSAL